MKKHVPIKSQKCSGYLKVPQLNNDITEAIRYRRHLERNWYKDKANVDPFTAFHCQHQLVSNLLEKAECELFFTSITENPLNYKHICDVCNCLLGQTKGSPLLSGYTNQELADKFNNYFTDKIAMICTNLTKKCQHLPPYMEITAAPEIQHFSESQPITLSRIKRMLLTTPCKSCKLNPISASLLKQILASTIEIIANIINISLRDGIFPESLKKVLVSPLLKKVNLDLMDRNYRPV